MTVTELESRITNLDAEVAILRQELEHLEIVLRIRRGLEDADADRITPAREALDALRRKHGIPLEPS